MSAAATTQPHEPLFSLISEKPPSSIALFGPPCCGKTHFIKAMLHHYKNYFTGGVIVVSDNVSTTHDYADLPDAKVVAMGNLDCSSFQARKRDAPPIAVVFEEMHHIPAAVMHHLLGL